MYPSVHIPILTCDHKLWVTKRRQFWRQAKMSVWHNLNILISGSPLWQSLVTVNSSFEIQLSPIGCCHCRASNKLCHSALLCRSGCSVLSLVTRLLHVARLHWKWIVACLFWCECTFMLDQRSPIPVLGGLQSSRVFCPSVVCGWTEIF